MQPTALVTRIWSVTRIGVQARSGRACEHFALCTHLRDLSGPLHSQTFRKASEPTSSTAGHTAAQPGAQGFLAEESAGRTRPSCRTLVCSDPVLCECCVRYRGVLPK